MFMSSIPGSDWMKKMKLVDCKLAYCIYFTKMVDSGNKLINTHEIDCNSKKYRNREVYSNQPRWEKWREVNLSEQVVAFNKFCR